MLSQPLVVAPRLSHSSRRLDTCPSPRPAPFPPSLARHPVHHRPRLVGLCQHLPLPRLRLCSPVCLPHSLPLAPSIIFTSPVDASPLLASPTSMPVPSLVAGGAPRPSSSLSRIRPPWARLGVSPRLTLHATDGSAPQEGGTASDGARAPPLQRRGSTGVRLMWSAARSARTRSGEGETGEAAQRDGALPSQGRPMCTPLAVSSTMFHCAHAISAASQRLAFVDSRGCGSAVRTRVGNIE